MKQCPKCKRSYADATLNFCLEDGSALVSLDSHDDQPTAILSDANDDRTQQGIRFCNTSDGVGIAYSMTGSGPLLVRVLGHFTHLEKEWEWPDLRYFWSGSPTTTRWSVMTGGVSVCRIDGTATFPRRPVRWIFMPC